MNKFTILFFFLTFFLHLSSVRSQNSISDCINAQPICLNQYSFSGNVGIGSVLNENIMPNTSMSPSYGCFSGPYLAGVQGQAWFYFKAQNNGNICLTISPSTPSTDYDWILFEVNGKNCNDLMTDPSLIYSANCNNGSGNTGPNGMAGANFNPCITANQGDEFLLLVNAFSSGVQGFDLTVEPTSTANITDNAAPQFISVQSPVSCSEDTIVIQFSEQIPCDSISPSKVEVKDASGNIVIVSDIFSDNCANNSSTRSSNFKVVIPAGLAAGNYTFTIIGNVTDDCGNSAQGQVQNFTVITSIQVNKNITGANCTNNNGSVTLTPLYGMAPYTYTWSNGLPGGVGNSNTQNNLNAGTYYVTIQDASGCQKIETIIVPLITPTITADITTNNTICMANNGSAMINSVNGGTGPYNYVWPDGSNGVNVSNLAMGNYNVTITDVNGCQLIKPFNIAQTNTALTSANNITNSICSAFNGSITVNPNNGTPTYTYLWNIIPSPGNINTVNNLDSGTYTVTITDINGCSGVQNIYVPASNVILSVNSNITNPNCTASDGILNINVTNGLSPFIYSWSNPVLTGTGNGGLSAGSYTVTITDANGCVKTETYSLTPDFSNEPTISLVSSFDTRCSNTSDGSAEVSSMGGFGIKTYTWSNGFLGSVNSPLAAGIYTVTVTDEKGCTDNMQVTISSPSPVLIGFIKDTVICEGGLATLTANVTGGNAPYNYSWSNGDVTQIIQVSPNIQSQYSVVGADANGCLSDTAKTTVSLFPAISSFIAKPGHICEGSSLNLSVTANGGNGIYQYAWSTGAASSTVSVSPSNTQTYFVTVTNGGGCANTPSVASVTVEVASKPVVQYTSNKANGCEDLDVLFSISNLQPSYSYSWNLGDGTIINNNSQVISHTYTQSGCKNVSLTVTSDSGCVSTSSNTCMIDVYPKPDIKFSYNPNNPTNLSPQVVFNDYTEDAVSWLWNIENKDIFTESNVRYTFPDVGEYEVSLSVTNKFGCTDTIQRIVNVEYQTVIYLPNAFTPNEDFLNNDFGPVGAGLTDDGFEFIIFDRWGDRVFTSNTLNNRWNGNYENSGKACKEGLYLYSVNYKDYYGAVQTVKGQVYLLNPLHD